MSPGFFRLVLLGKRTDESSRLFVFYSQLCLQFLISPQPYCLRYLSHEQRSDDDGQYLSHAFTLTFLGRPAGLVANAGLLKYRQQISTMAADRVSPVSLPNSSSTFQNSCEALTP